MVAEIVELVERNMGLDIMRDISYSRVAVSGIVSDVTIKRQAPAVHTSRCRTLQRRGFALGEDMGETKGYKMKRYELWERGVSRCTRCKKIKPLVDFARDENPQWRCKTYSYWCKECKLGKDKETRPYRHRKTMMDRSAPERIAFRKQRMAAHSKYRKRALAGYGSKCACCGEDRFEFLVFDHVENDGNEHRKKLNTSCIAGWIIRNNFPDSIQVLCHNCNMAKAFHGKCPHKERRS